MRAADPAELRQRDLAVADRMVRDDVDGGGRARTDRAFEVIGPGVGRGAHGHHLGAGEADRLLDRGAVVDHVPGLDHDLAPLEPGRVRQPLDPGEVGTGHAAGDRDGDARRRQRR